MHNLYSISNSIFNNDLDNYIEIILKDIFLKIPIEIIKNIVKYMDLNYQWIEIRKFYKLDNSPLTLDFNLKNYKNICEKYLLNLTIIFIYGNHPFYRSGPDLYYIVKLLNFKYDKTVDIIYNINNFTIYNNIPDDCICVNNLNIDDIRKIKNISDRYKKQHFEKFIENVYNNNKWKSSIDIEDFWNIKMDIIKEYQENHKPKHDQHHMDVYYNIFNESTKYEAAFHACICVIFDNYNNCKEVNIFNKYQKQIKLKDYIKEITSFLTLIETHIGIIIGDDIVVGNLWQEEGFTVIDINPINGVSKISELTSFTHLKIISIIELTKKYRDLILS